MQAVPKRRPRSKVKVSQTTLSIKLVTSTKVVVGTLPKSFSQPVSITPNMKRHLRAIHTVTLSLSRSYSQQDVQQLVQMPMLTETTSIPIQQLPILTESLSFPRRISPINFLDQSKRFIITSAALLTLVATLAIQELQLLFLSKIPTILSEQTRLQMWI